MKKILLLSLSMAFILTSLNVFGQNQGVVVPDHIRNVKKSRTRIMAEPFVESIQIPVNPSPLTVRENAQGYIGTTQYDLQSNNSVRNGFYRDEDGNMGAVWTQGFMSPDFADRGTGYNSFDGTNWGPMPTARLEASVRTGWPSITKLADGSEFIGAHVFDAGAYRIHTLKRAAGETTWTEGDVTSDAVPEGILWPRLCSSGNTIHMVAVTDPDVTYEGVKTHMMYYRSSDGGVTWDMKDVILPGIDSTSFVDMSADEYAIDANGDNVAVAYFGGWNDVVVAKSTDGGETWSSTVVLDFPLDKHAYGAEYTVADIPVLDNPPNGDTMAIETSDGVGSVLVDNDGIAHLWVGRMLVTDVDFTDANTSYYPGTNLMIYWNETLGGQYYDLYDDVNGNDTIDVVNTGGLYYTSLTAQPSMGVDNSNNLFMAFSGLKEGDEFYNADQDQNFRHIYVIGSPDHGENWSDPIDIITEELSPAEDIYNSVETVFPMMAKFVEDEVHIVYQEDFSPGLNVRGDEDPVGDNNIAYQSYDAIAVLTGNTEVVAPQEVGFKISPNPTSDRFFVSFETQSSVRASVTLVNLLGQSVTSMDLGQQSGKNIVDLNVNDVAPGVYFIKLQLGDSISTQKVVIK